MRCGRKQIVCAWWGVGRRGGERTKAIRIGEVKRIGGKKTKFSRGSDGSTLFFNLMEKKAQKT